jgi:hypothetical protein
MSPACRARENGGGKGGIRTVLARRWRNDKAEVEKGGAVVSPPSVERREGQPADAQMTGW